MFHHFNTLRLISSRESVRGHRGQIQLVSGHWVATGSLVAVFFCNFFAGAFFAAFLAAAFFAGTSPAFTAAAFFAAQRFFW